MRNPKPLYDIWLLMCVLVLIAIGFIMVVSASMPITESYNVGIYYFSERQLIRLLIGIGCCFGVTFIPIKYWIKYGPIFLILSLLLLVLVLIPGIGKELNGAKRWLKFAGISIQPSEILKLSFIIYLAGYLVRKEQEVKEKLIGFLKPMFILILVSMLLLLEPDFGALVVIISSSLGLMFLSEIPLKRFIALVSVVAVSLISVAIISPYRINRLTSFLHPWENQFDSGYQLTQSLIAIGTGGLFGKGIGNSVQKLHYLPEAHTDFIYAILSEELGLLGAITVVGLFMFFVIRSLMIGKESNLNKNKQSAYLAYGISLWIGFQAMINIGVNIGLLPTKGLTLPLMSYGGSSIVVVFVALGLLFRIDYENRINIRRK